MIITLTSLDDERLAPFASLTEAQLRSAPMPLFIAESPKVITTALDAGMEPVALLAERRHIEGDAAPIVRRIGGCPVFTGSRELLQSLTGYRLTRGVLCAMRRPALPSLEAVAAEARRIVVVDGVCDTTNIGAIFRAAAALGIDGVVLTPTACDPLNRRAVRVSMGSVFLLPWTVADNAAMRLHALGFTTLAMALRHDALSLADRALRRLGRVAIIMGTEGDGLAPDVISAADIVVTIPMAHGVDSLNVASAAAVAFWQLRPDSDASSEKNEKILEKNFLNQN